MRPPPPLLAIATLTACRTAPSVPSTAAVDAASAVVGQPSIVVASAPAPLPAVDPTSVSRASTRAYASAARSSRVTVPARRYASLQRVAGLPPPPEKIGFVGPPRFVVLSPDGRHVGVQYPSGYDVRSADGSVVAVGHFASERAGLTMLDEEYFAGGAASSWSGASTVSGLTWVVGKDWALRRDGTRISDVFWQPFMQGPEGTSVEASIEAKELEVRGAKLHELCAHREAIDGCGAVREDHAVILALADGRVQLLEPAAGGYRMRETKHPFVARDVSVVGQTYALLSREADGSTTLHLLDAAGGELWAARVPFDATQPAIDGGGGRIYLAGSGLAAIEGGKVLWSSPAPSLATAFVDGALAVATGGELQIVRRDGVVNQVFRVPERATIVTPPAIGADSSVWFATADALYALR